MDGPPVAPCFLCCFWFILNCYNETGGPSISNQYPFPCIQCSNGMSDGRWLSLWAREYPESYWWELSLISLISLWTQNNLSIMVSFLGTHHVCSGGQDPWTSRSVLKLQPCWSTLASHFCSADILKRAAGFQVLYVVLYTLPGNVFFNLMFRISWSY